MTTTTIRAPSSHDGGVRFPVKARLFGAGVAGAVSLSLAAIPPDLVWFGSLTLDLRGLGLAGAPVAFVLGYWLTPYLARASRRGGAGIGIGLGVAAAYLGVLELALVSLISALLGFDSTTGFTNDVTAALFIATVGLPFGTLVLPITIPCGLAWALIVHPFVRRLAMPSQQR